MRLRLVARNCPYGFSRGGTCQLGFPGCACADDMFVAYHDGGMATDLEKRREQLVESLRIELTALRASLPAERRKAAEAGWEAGGTHSAGLQDGAIDMASVGTWEEERDKWLNENYPEGAT